jgi:hypothetical protein
LWQRRAARRRATRATAQQDIAGFLEARFGELPPDLVEAIESVGGEKELKDLVRSAAVCADLAAFRRAIARG